MAALARKPKGKMENFSGSPKYDAKNWAYELITKAAKKKHTKI